MAAKKTKRRGVRPFNPFVASGNWDVTVERRGRGWRWSLVLLPAVGMAVAGQVKTLKSTRIDGSSPAYSSPASAKRGARAWLRERGLV